MRDSRAWRRRRPTPEPRCAGTSGARRSRRVASPRGQAPESRPAHHLSPTAQQEQQPTSPTPYETPIELPLSRSKSSLASAVDRPYHRRSISPKRANISPAVDESRLRCGQPRQYARSRRRSGSVATLLLYRDDAEAQPIGFALGDRLRSRAWTAFLGGCCWSRVRRGGRQNGSCELGSGGTWSGAVFPSSRQSGRLF